MNNIPARSPVRQQMDQVAPRQGVTDGQQRQLHHPDPTQRARIEDLRLLLGSVLEARRRVMIEVNVSSDRLQALVDILPCLREPTVSPLHGDGFAVKAAVPRAELSVVVPRIKAAGGTDLVVSAIAQLVP